MGLFDMDQNKNSGGGANTQQGSSNPLSSRPSPQPPVSGSIFGNPTTQATANFNTQAGGPSAPASSLFSGGTQGGQNPLFGGGSTTTQPAQSSNTFLGGQNATTSTGTLFGGSKSAENGAAGVASSNCVFVFYKSLFPSLTLFMSVFAKPAPIPSTGASVSSKYPG
jgi:hypothetical protein